MPLERTTRNALALCELCGRLDVPVHAGCTRPLRCEPVLAADFHGESGLGTLRLPEPRAHAAPGSAVDFIASTVLAREPQSVTVAVTGPLTNLAAAFEQQPRLAARLQQVVWMGGARREGGNITASAEYNAYADPHAAEIVLRAGCPIVVIGLDATHQVRSTGARVAALRALGGSYAHAAAELMHFSNAIERRLSGGDGAPLHDPCVVAWLLDNALFQTAPVDLRIETDSALTRGHTAVEFRNPHGGARHVRWVTEADANGIFDLLMLHLRP